MMKKNGTDTNERPLLQECQQYWEGTNDNMCNFVLKVLRKIEIKIKDEIVTHVVMKLCFEDGESDEIIIPLLELRKTDWYAREQRCIFALNCRNPGRYVENEVRKQLGQVPV